VSGDRGLLAIIWVLLGVVVFSALMLVHGRHETRSLFMELNSLSRERDRLDTEWSKLQIEQGAWATHGRIERIANQQLGMATPNRDAVVILILEQRN